MIDTNNKGLIYMTRAVLPGMVERNRGHIIALSVQQVGLMLVATSMARRKPLCASFSLICARIYTARRFA